MTGGILADQPFSPRPPTALNLHVRHDAAGHALRSRDRLCGEGALTPGFRAACDACRDALARRIADRP